MPKGGAKNGQRAEIYIGDLGGFARLFKMFIAEKDATLYRIGRLASFWDRLTSASDAADGRVHRARDITAQQVLSR